MFFDRLDGDRFFARLWGLDMECPICGKVYILDTRRSTRKIGRRVPLFFCTRPTCQTKLLLGVIAWEPRPGPVAIPPDVVPTIEQAQSLQELLTGRSVGRRAQRQRQVNVVLREQCTCPLECINGVWQTVRNPACRSCNVNPEPDVP